MVFRFWISIQIWYYLINFVSIAQETKNFSQTFKIKLFCSWSGSANSLPAPLEQNGFQILIQHQNLIIFDKFCIYCLRNKKVFQTFKIKLFCSWSCSANSLPASLVEKSFQIQIQHQNLIFFDKFCMYCSRNKKIFFKLLKLNYFALEVAVLIRCLHL